MTATDTTAAGFDSRAVANWFLDRADADGRELTHAQLQKLVYLAHGWHLANVGKPLIRDEVQAWPYGPIIPVLYQEFKQYGDLPINGRAFEFDFGRRENVDIAADLPAVTLSVLEKTWIAYGDFSGADLSAFTSEEGSPWAEVVKSKPLVVRTKPPALTDAVLKRFYDEQLALIRSRP